MSLRLIAAAVLLTGCGTMVIPQEAQVIRDFVVVSDLERVDNIRHNRPLYYGYVNDYFVTTSIGNRHYVVELDSRCRALRSKTFSPAMVDHPHDPSYLRARDTIRGCPVDKIYKATAEQLKEIKAIGKAKAIGTVVPAEG